MDKQGKYLWFKNHVLTIAPQVPELIVKKRSKTKKIDIDWIKKRLLEIVDVNGIDKLRELATEILNTYRIYIRIAEFMIDPSEAGSLPIKPKKIEFGGEQVMSDKIAKGIQELANEHLGIQVSERPIRNFLENEEVEPLLNEQTLKSNVILFTILASFAIAFESRKNIVKHTNELQDYDIYEEFGLNNRQTRNFDYDSNIINEARLQKDRRYGKNLYFYNKPEDDGTRFFGYDEFVEIVDEGLDPLDFIVGDKEYVFGIIDGLKRDLNELTPQKYANEIKRLHRITYNNLSAKPKKIKFGKKRKPKQKIRDDQKITKIQPSLLKTEEEIEDIIDLPDEQKEIDFDKILDEDAIDLTKYQRDPQDELDFRTGGIPIIRKLDDVKKIRKFRPIALEDDFDYIDFIYFIKDIKNLRNNLFKLKKFRHSSLSNLRRNMDKIQEQQKAGKIKLKGTAKKKFKRAIRVFNRKYKKFEEYGDFRNTIKDEKDLAYIREYFEIEPNEDFDYIDLLFIITKNEKPELANPIINSNYHHLHRNYNKIKKQMKTSDLDVRSDLKKKAITMIEDFEDEYDIFTTYVLPQQIIEHQEPGIFQEDYDKTKYNNYTNGILDLPLDIDMAEYMENIVDIFADQEQAENIKIKQEQEYKVVEEEEEEELVNTSPDIVINKFSDVEKIRKYTKLKKNSIFDFIDLIYLIYNTENPSQTAFFKESEYELLRDNMDIVKWEITCTNVKLGKKVEHELKTLIHDFDLRYEDYVLKGGIKRRETDVLIGFQSYAQEQRIAKEKRIEKEIRLAEENKGMFYKYIDNFYSNFIGGKVEEKEEPIIEEQVNPIEIPEILEQNINNLDAIVDSHFTSRKKFIYQELDDIDAVQSELNPIKRYYTHQYTLEDMILLVRDYDNLVDYETFRNFSPSWSYRNMKNLRLQYYDRLEELGPVVRAKLRTVFDDFFYKDYQFLYDYWNIGDKWLEHPKVPKGQEYYEELAKSIEEKHDMRKEIAAELYNEGKKSFRAQYTKALKQRIEKIKKDEKQAKERAEKHAQDQAERDEKWQKGQFGSSYGKKKF